MCLTSDTRVADLEEGLEFLQTRLRALEDGVRHPYPAGLSSRAPAVGQCQHVLVTADVAEEQGDAATHLHAAVLGRQQQHGLVRLAGRHELLRVTHLLGLG